MSQFIWSKGDGSVSDETVMEFMAGEDLDLDTELLPYDIRASQAHARGLVDAGILSTAEAQQLVTTLDEIAAAVSSGGRRLGPEFEDGHSAIEAWLIEQLGDLGRKIHTGRSRNDQVGVALRLWMKDRLGQLAATCADIAEGCLVEAAAGEWQPMPGYTHLQRAMPSSLGLWFAGHAEAFIDNLELALLTRRWLDACPLGTASGFGVNLDLPRQAVSEELGFSRLVVNPQYAQNARGKVELQAVTALAAASGDLRRLAWDLSLFASSEFGFVRLPDAYCTGSSIMPNKRNPDAVELLRGLHPVVIGAQAELAASLSLPSGYQRDLQVTKAPLIRAFDRGLKGLSLVPGLLSKLSWDAGRMEQAISKEMHATDLAIEKSRQGEAFRTAYQEAAKEISQSGPRDSLASLEQRISPGACGRLELGLLQTRLDSLAGAGQN